MNSYGTQGTLEEFLMRKGDKRRPMKISQEELDKRWEAVFKNKPAEDMFDHLMIDKILTKEVEK